MDLTADEEIAAILDADDPFNPIAQLPLELIKENVPLEADAGPQEVFSVIEEALRIHFAKDQTELIEG